jgi:ketosteroid isomerase-like protein
MVGSALPLDRSGSLNRTGIVADRRCASRDTASITAHDNEELMRAVVQAFNRRDVAMLEPLLAQDVEIVPIRAALEGTVYRGANAAAEWYAAVDGSWDDLTVVVDEVRAHGDQVLGLGRVRGRGRESGVAIDVEAAAVARLHDGLITHLRIYTERAKALEAFDG